jgi:ligand-binding sensor domain-containing protein
MQESPENGNKQLSSNPFIAFFQNPEVPGKIKGGLVLVFLLLITYPFFGGSSDSARDQIAPLSQDGMNFPSGPAGLDSTDVASEQAAAAAAEIKEELEEDKPSESIERIRRLGKIGESAEVKEVVVENESIRIRNKEKQSSKKPTPGPFIHVLQHITWPIAMLSDGKKNEWLAHRKGIELLKEGDPRDSRIILSDKTYDAEFNDDLPLITSLSKADGDSIWLGFDAGQLMLYERYEWKMISKRREVMSTPIRAIIRSKEHTFLGARDLFQWDPTLRRVIPNPNMKGKWIESFATNSEGEIYSAGRKGLWKYDANAEQTWTQLWELPRKARTIRSITPTDDGGFILGTVNGLYRIKSAGTVSERHLDGVSVQSVTPVGDDALWVATRNGGLRYYDGEQWYIADSSTGLGDMITFAHIDQKGLFWLGVQGVGVFIAPLKKAEAWIKKHPEVVENDYEPKSFSDACHAASEVLEGLSLSGDVSVEVVDGRGTVFVKGRQVCPTGVGYHRVDGTTLLLNGWNLLHYKEQKRIEIALPKSIPADQASYILLDSSDTAWLGTKGAGLFKGPLDNPDKWTAVEASEFNDNPVSKIIEDERGNIWVGSTPPYDNEQETYHLKNLHLFNKKGAFHYDSRNNLLHSSTEDLAVRKDGTLVIGSKAGVSLLDTKANVTNYGVKHGLSPKYANSVQLDSKERIWLTHLYYGEGISWIDGDQLFRVTEKEGLFSNKARLIAHDGKKRVWVFSTNGRVGVYPMSFLTERARSHPLKSNLIRSISLFAK